MNPTIVWVEPSESHRSKEREMTVTVTAPLGAGDAGPRAALAARPAHAVRQVDPDRTLPDIVDVWGRDSFPASDAPANW
jgi:hypothetical protein